jgi:predicted  nucleic acid-binding Zn-ribbon protein
MHADIERLIALQHLDTQTHAAEKLLASEPERLKALDARLEHAKQQVTSAKELLAQNQTARRELEKGIALHQGRLSKFREQGMNVKTNQEYHAIQHEIAFAQTEIKTIEDKELELMMSADDISAAIKKAEAELAAEQKAADAEKTVITAEHDEKRALVDQLKAERRGVVAGLAPNVLALFEQVSKKRNGIAVAEARDGICTICHVRMRPQVFNNVRSNQTILQCDSCQRILYFVPAPAAPTTTPTA